MRIMMMNAAVRRLRSRTVLWTAAAIAAVIGAIGVTFGAAALLCAAEAINLAK